MSDLVMVDADGNAVVLVDEEYGYQRHLWFTGMTPAALEAYWAAIPCMMDHYMDPTKSLPGRWETAVTSDDMDAWLEALESGEMYHAHIHSEDDSFLNAPDGRSIYHAGYIEG